MFSLNKWAAILQEEARLTLAEQALLFGLSVSQYYLLRKRNAPIGRKRLSILTREYPHIVASASKYKTPKSQKVGKAELLRSISHIDVQLNAIYQQLEALKVLLKKAS